jgi:hypothetical protein
MFSLPALRDEGILEGFRLHRERTREVRPTLPAKSIPVPSSSDLCALCVSALSSPNVDALDAASSISPMFATLLPRAAAQGTKNTRAWVSVPIINPNSQFNRRLTSNSHRITSFADPHPLTPIESYPCKKQGEGSPLPQVGGEGPHIFAQHAGISATSISSGVYFTTRVHHGGRGYFDRSRPYLNNSLRVCFRLLSHSNKSGCSRVIRSHIGWNWNQPASGMPTCEWVSLAVS